MLLFRAVQHAGSAASAAGPLSLKFDAVEDTDSAESKQAPSVEESHNLDEVEPNAIHDAVISVNHLTKPSRRRPQGNSKMPTLYSIHSSELWTA